MTIRKITAWMWALLGVLLAVGTIGTAVYALDAQPVIWQQPLGAEERAAELMDAICRGDFEHAQMSLYRTPSFGVQAEGDGIEARIWDAFVNSLEYEFQGLCYATQSGIAVDVQIRSLDIPSVTLAMRKHAEELLKQRVEQAENVSDVYDESNNYREDFVTRILQDAATEALTEAHTLREQTVPLYLTFEGGQWWVMPTQQLVNVLSGF